MSGKGWLPATFLEKLKGKLDHYGPVQHVESANRWVEVASAGKDGFDVRAAPGDGGIAVGYECWHWHEDFESDDEALNCFMSGVFGESRLAVTKHGNFAHSWTAELLNDGRWVPFSTTAYLFFPFWLKRQVVHLQNNRTARNRNP